MNQAEAERSLQREAAGIFVTRKADILVVDDDAQVVELFSRILRAEGHRVREALTGGQGLELARAEYPDVMLLDVRLPDMSGIEVCRQIKAQPALADVFVIMVSGEAISPAEKVDGLEVGADEYLAKPVALNELLARVRTALRLRDTLAALREGEARYRGIFENATEGIFQSTLEGRLLNANPALARMLGYETAQALKSSITDAGRQLYVNPARRRELKRLLEEEGSVQGFQAELLHKEGRRLWVIVNAHLVRDSKGTVLHLEGTAQDITERKRLEKAILEVSEREQRLVGQDIHDGLCQRLFCTAVGCNLLRENLAAQSRPEAEEAARVLAQLHAAISEARSLAYGLSLANLDKRGLAAALGDLASTTSLDCRIPCVAECPGSVPISNPTTANHLYRIAREAVHNAVKHARPSRILIRLEATAEGGRLSVVDDGCGIPDGQSPGSGMGFDMMRYRANMVGGELKLQRGPAGGTIITCMFPVNALVFVSSH